MNNLIWITLTATLPVLVYSHFYQQTRKSENQCDCQCSGFLSEGHTRDLPFCKKLMWLEKEYKSIKHGLESRTQHIHELNDLKDRVAWQEEHFETLKKEVEALKKELSSKGDPLPIPELLIMRPEDHMVGDTSLDTRITDADKELAKDVSSLLAKVEEVENRTTQVQEELKSERRVRRHLEEDLNETRYSIRVLDDKLHNVSSTRNDHVEEMFLSSLESMNKTFYEDHLQKLYYKVDGVVYKNETKQLDKRLDQVESDLSEVSNNTALEMVYLEVQALTEEVKALRNLSQTVTEGLASENIRLDVLENKTQELKEEQLKFFENVTAMVQEGVTNVRNDLMEIGNKTYDLENSLLLQQANFSASLNDTLKLMTSANTEIDDLKEEFTKSTDLYSEMEKELKLLSADVAVAENRIHDLKLQSESEIQDVYRKMDNVTDTMESSIHSLVALLMEKTTDKPLVNASNTNVNNSNVTEDKSNRSRSKEAEPTPCTLPSFNDTHLLVTVQENDEGLQELVFGCLPVGRYVLNRPSVPLRCEDGEWNGPIPVCMKLLDEKEIKEVSNKLESENPCLFSPGENPDPTDCHHFFKCWIGKSERFLCPSNLHFDKITKRCDYPRVANCKTYVTEETALLSNVTPAIHVEPDNIDKPFGMMGTSDSGELVVYPRTRFTLKCIFPSNRWDLPTWKVDLFLPNSTSKDMVLTREKNALRMTVVANSQEDSGIYSCVSPFGKQNSITIVVQAVTCPTIPMGPGIRDILYRPNPDGVYRGLTTSVEYECHNGASVKGYCMANGKWSRPSPTSEECQSDEFVPQTLWGCPFINPDGYPNLILERNEHDMTLTFKCAGNTYLIGSTFTRCYNGNWTHQAIPRCETKRPWG